MNKIYSLVRSPSTGKLVVASELAKSHGKGGRRTLAVALGLLGAQAAGAQTVTMQDFNPLNCDGATSCVTTVSDGNDVTLVGQGTQILRGQTGAAGSVQLSALFASGQTTSPYADPNNPLSLVINTGAASTNLVVKDPITGANRTVLVYDNANFADSHATAMGEGVPPYAVSTSAAVNGMQYINTRIGQVDSSGGTMTVNIGNGGDTNATGNSISMIAKQTSLFQADGSGTEQSKVVWASNNRVDLGLAASVATSSQAGNSAKFIFSKYNGAITAFDGSVHQVTSAAELADYNTFLIQKLNSGALAPDQYASQFAMAYTNTPQTIDFENGPLDKSDEVYQGLGVRAVIHAIGDNGVGEVAAGAHLDVNSASATVGGLGAVMLAEQGATIVNNGQIGSVRSGSSDFQYAMYAQGGSHAINSGVVNAGSLTGVAGNHDPVNPAIILGANNGIAALDSYSTAVNDGILNVSGVGSIGIVVGGGARASNGGIINVNTGDASSSGPSTRSMAVSVGANSTFTNETDGEIYLGRELQYDAATPGANVRNLSPMVGVYTGSNGANVFNRGAITIGGLAQAATGMLKNGGDGMFKNEGVINVNGAASDAPAENVGMYLTNPAPSGMVSAENGGTINVDGVNGIGIKSKSTTAAEARIVSMGTINVDGAKSSTGLRNYGGWAEGANAVLDIGGDVNLSGDGAIGVHARDGGRVELNGGGVNFLSGSDQVGFFAYGTGSRVDINVDDGSKLEVGTAGSTLFRIEDGATFNNSNDASLVASGAGSTAIHVTGAGSVANLDGMDITVSGAGANALKVEGGAKGQMGGAAKLTLADQATAVVVDDNKYDINGVLIGRGDSSFVNTADVTVQDSKDVTIFRVKNGAELVNAGNIDLSHGTAIEVMGNGSRVLADAIGKRGTITVHDGIAGIHVHDGASLSTADTITVDGAASGVLIGADAGRVVVEKDAHITGLGSGYGNLISNRAEAATTLIDGATLEMAGSGAALLSENNIDAASHGYVLVSSQSGGKGIALSNSDGSTTAGSLDIGSGWNIDVTGNGAGVYANTSGDMRINGNTINVSGPGNAIKADNAGSVVVDAGTVITGSHADAELVVGNPTSFINNGTITSVDRTATAMRLGDGASVVDNTGTITGLVALGDGADCLHNSGTIDGDVSLGGGNDCAFVTGGTITGTLSGDEGDDSIVLEGATVAAVDGGAGSDTIVLRGPTASTFQRLSGGIGDGEEDTLLLDGYTHVHDKGSAALEDFEHIDLTNSSTLDLRTTLALGDNGNGNGTLGIQNGSTLLANQGPAKMVGNVANAGLVQIAGAQVGQTLAVQGDYAGMGGTVQINTVLDSDDSATDQLVVQGNTSGQTALKVTNVGGAGNYTLNDGIEVVKVGGRSEGDFALAGRAVAGAYEYLLVKGGKTDAGNGNWYLRSEAPVPPVQPEPELPTDPTPPVQPDPELPTDPTPPVRPDPELPTAPEPSLPTEPVEPVTPPTSGGRLYRPETGAYLANQAAAAGMFNHTLHDRVGELDWQERQRNGDDKLTSVWSRVQRNQFDGITGQDQVKTSTDTSLVQIGADMVDWTSGNSRINAGVMGGMGRANSQSSSLTYGAKGKVTGKSLGLYSTWYGSSAQATGAYVDASLQYAQYDNEVHGDLLNKERYGSHSLTGSVEAGYAIELARGDTSAFYVEPQAQVIYTRMGGGNHVEADGSDIRAGNAGGLTSRVGARIYTRQLSTAYNRVQPFAELNWWHGGNENTMTFNGVSMNQSRSRDIQELKVGAQMELGGGWSGWGHAGFQTGDNHHRNVQGMIGVKHSW